MPKSDEELQADWAAELNPAQDFAIRDSLIKVMHDRGVRPSTWLHDRDTRYGLYPDIEDPEFASLLYRKTEFASLASVMPPENSCTLSKSYFETTPVQRLVARFLHPTTPYNGILLNHGVGVGKTCSAVTVAETFLEYMPTHTVFILAPQAIADGFRRTIFDGGKLAEASKEHTRLTGERWTSSQCTGMTYPRLSGTADNESRETVIKESEKLIRRRYAIMGYQAFSNWVKRKLATAVPQTITGAAREREENAVIAQIFADHLIIIDEAHNLRDDRGGVDRAGADEVNPSLVNDSAAGKALTPVLRRIVEVAEGLRLMLMTATPMYNTAPEIIFLLNILMLNDTKDVRRLLKETDFFKPDGTLKEESGPALATVVRRYVSYMRGENPNTFPLRLTPPESNVAALVAAYPRVSVKRSEGETVLPELQQNIMKSLPIVVSSVGPDSFLGKILHAKYAENATAPADREDDELSNFVLSQFMQMSNMTYPNGTSAAIGLGTYTKRALTMVKGTKVAQFTWNEGKLQDGSDAPALDAVFGRGLETYAPKIARIVDSCVAGTGMSFVFSRFIAAGAVPIALAMEVRGYCRCLADGTPAPLLRRSAPAGGYKGYYILLTSDDELSPNFKGVLEYATTFKDGDEADGRKVKMIIGSAIASEGLDLKCIRELHVLDSWYHLNRTEQITGRGVRFCSHSLLPADQRNCLVYLHAVSIQEYETADLYAYRIAVRKAIPIGQVTRLMKINAWDCMLNVDAIMLKALPARRITDAHKRVIEEYELKDKPYTSFCDYNDRCEYICGGKTEGIEAAMGTDKSTYTEFDFRSLFLEKQKILATIFSTEVAEPLDKIKTIVYGDIPWSIAAIGLREALGTIRIKRKDGLYGTLVLMNDYIVFQPASVTDTAIPAALRYGRAYGRLPRSVTPMRGSVLMYSAPTAAASTVPAVPASALPVEEGKEDEGERKEDESVDKSGLFASAMAGIGVWKTILHDILSKPTGPVAKPLNFKDETLNGLRWVYHHFAELEETTPIALKWWMDNVWTVGERAAVCAEYTRRGVATLAGDDAAYARLLQPVELFTGAINGYFEYKDEKLQPHCLIEGEAAPAACPTSYMPTVNGIIGPAVDRVADTDDIFGMLVIKSGITIFKTVDKKAGKVLKLEGAECANQSNLPNHWSRLKNLHAKIRTAFGADAPIIRLLLSEDPAAFITDTKERATIQDAVKKLYDPSVSAADPSLRITHISHLSLKQLCPYMEFLLRLMDMRRVGGKRWFLPLVDAVRAGAKMSE